MATTAGSIYVITMATGALAALTACSSDSAREAPASPKESPASPAVVALQGPPPGAKVLGTLHKGEPFTITINYSDSSDSDKLKLTVNSVICGKPLDQKPLTYAAESTGESVPTPKPESGKQYCVITLDTENVGNSEVVWETDDTVSLNVGATRYTQTQDDIKHASDYGQYWAHKGKTGPSFGINPGSKGPAPGIFQIPIGATPTSLWVTTGTAMETINGVEPGYLVQL